MFSSMQPTELKDVIENYLPAFERLLKAIDSNAIERIARRLCVARENEATIYVAGNGGSAADAQHIKASNAPHGSL